MMIIIGNEWCIFVPILEKVQYLAFNLKVSWDDLAGICLMHYNDIIMLLCFICMRREIHKLIYDSFMQLQ